MTKKLITTTLFFVLLYSGYAQEHTSAQFPGGNDSLDAFILNNIEYPKLLKKVKEFDVVAHVLVREDGSAEFVKIAKPKNVEEPIEREVKRLIKAMPMWQPTVKIHNDCERVKTKDIVQITFPFRRYNIHIPGKISVELKEAGTLGKMLTQEQMDTCRYLEVKGKVNSRDIAVLRKMAGGDGGKGCLKLLDMRMVKIVTENKVPYLSLDVLRNGLESVPYEETFDGPSSSQSYLSKSKNSISFPGYWNFEGDAAKYQDGWHYRNRLKNDNILKKVIFILMGEKNIAKNDTTNWYDQVDWNKAKLKKKHSHRFNGHELCLVDGRCIYKAYTKKGMYSTDMFYQCPHIQRIIMPFDQAENLEIEVPNLKHRYLR